MRNIRAIFKKQLKETLKNKVILIQFLMFPVMAVIMENVINIKDMPDHFFAKLFAVMYVGMAPLVCMSSIIAEEKEVNTLRVLLMSNVKPREYMMGTGSYVWLMCMIGSLVFAFCGGYSNGEFWAFMLIMGFGIMLSELTGAIIGVCCKNQMTATSIMVPVMMVFSFLPMLSMFNDTIKNVAKVIYSQQLNIIINDLGYASPEPESYIILAANLVVAVGIFTLVFRKKGLE